MPNLPITSPLEFYSLCKRVAKTMFRYDKHRQREQLEDLDLAHNAYLKLLYGEPKAEQGRTTKLIVLPIAWITCWHRIEQTMRNSLRYRGIEARTESLDVPAHPEENNEDTLLDNLCAGLNPWEGLYMTRPAKRTLKRVFSAQAKENMRKAHIGKKLSEVTKKKMSKAHKRSTLAYKASKEK